MINIKGLFHKKMRVLHKDYFIRPFLFCMRLKMTLVEKKRSHLSSWAKLMPILSRIIGYMMIILPHYEILCSPLPISYSFIQVISSINSTLFHSCFFI